ncbi:MAG: hypothetical protein LBB90_03350 [Tannerella sp.]|jgi:hypothetical protein|nr:hypothetical protein [Tannerella sp.]
MTVQAAPKVSKPEAEEYPKQIFPKSNRIFNGEASIAVKNMRAFAVKVRTFGVKVRTFAVKVRTFGAKVRTFDVKVRAFGGQTPVLLKTI